MSGSSLHIHDKLIGSKATVNGVECLILAVHDLRDDGVMVYGMTPTGTVYAQLLDRIKIIVTEGKQTP